MKRLLQSLLCKMYIVGKIEYERRLPLRMRTHYNTQAAIGHDSIIHSSATIHNHQNNRKSILIGNCTRIEGHLMVWKHGGSITIGEHCFVGKNTRIWSAKRITVGNRVLISHNVNIHDNISHPLNAMKRHEDFKHIFQSGFQDFVELHEKEIVIGDDVWIGFNATILKGVTIGRGSIIGANAVITKDIPEFSVVVNEPEIKIIKQSD